jgi:MFS family permease
MVARPPILELSDMEAKASATADETSIRYEGWRIVAVCFLLATFGWALGFYGQTVYLAELKRIFGWPAALIASATTFFYLVGAVLVAFLSDAIRVVGPRRCLLAGIVTLAVATALLGRIETPLQLFAAYGLLAVGWAGTSLGAVTNTIGLWFDKKRGMAISLALNGASFGGVVGVPLMAAAIGAYGFSTATLMGAGLLLVVMIPAVLLVIGTPPRRPEPAPGVVVETMAQMRAQALRDRKFITLMTAFSLVLFVQVGFIVHLIAYLDPLIGRERAAAAVSLLTLMAVVGRLLVGTVIDRVDQRAVSAASFLSQSVALIVLLSTTNSTAIFACCALFGFSVGNLITLPALIVQREYPPQAFGVLVSLLTAVTQVAYSFGPGIVGVLRDASGGYTLPFLMGLALQAIAAALIVSGRRPQA